MKIFLFTVIAFLVQYSTKKSGGYYLPNLDPEIFDISVTNDVKLQIDKSYSMSDFIIHGILLTSSEIKHKIMQTKNKIVFQSLIGTIRRKGEQFIVAQLQGFQSLIGTIRSHAII